MEFNQKRKGFIPIFLIIVLTVFIILFSYAGGIGVLMMIAKNFMGAATGTTGDSARGVSTECYMPDQYWKDPSSELNLEEVKKRVESYRSISNASRDANLQKLLTYSREKGYNPAVTLAIWGKESTYSTRTRNGHDFGYLLEGWGGFDKQLKAAVRTLDRAFKKDSPYAPKSPGQPIQVYWIDTYTPSSDPKNANDRKTFFTILKQAVPGQVTCTSLEEAESGGGDDDFSGEMRGEQVGRWTNVDQIFAYLGGKNPAAARKHLISFKWLGVRLEMNKEAAVAMKKVEKDFLASGIKYKIRQKDTGGYHWRTNENNHSVISPHSTGMAVDVNWKSNGNGRRQNSCPAREISCCPHDIPKALSDAFQKNGFFWGARFKNVCDAMHFQYGGNYN